MGKHKTLTFDQIGQMCEWYANGWNVIDIAKMLRKDRGTISKSLDSHYRMKYKDIVVVVMQSKINDEKG